MMIPVRRPDEILIAELPSPELLIPRRKLRPRFGTASSRYAPQFTRSLRH